MQKEKRGKERGRKESLYSQSGKGIKKRWQLMKLKETKLHLKIAVSLMPISYKWSMTSISRDSKMRFRFFLILLEGKEIGCKEKWKSSLT